MSETQLEMRQAKGEDEKREKLMTKTVDDISNIISENSSYAEWQEVKKYLIDFVIEKGYAIE